jgi:hypothetical protein
MSPIRSLVGSVLMLLLSPYATVTAQSVVVFSGDITDAVDFFEPLAGGTFVATYAYPEQAAAAGAQARYLGDYSIALHDASGTELFQILDGGDGPLDIRIRNDFRAPRPPGLPPAPFEDSILFTGGDSINGFTHASIPDASSHGNSVVASTFLGFIRTDAATAPTALTSVSLPLDGSEFDFAPWNPDVLASNIGTNKALFVAGHELIIDHSDPAFPIITKPQIGVLTGEITGVTFTAVPEPHAVALFLVGLLPLVPILGPSRGRYRTARQQ